MDVAGWLRGLGLGQFEANFRDNKIDADVLPQLTADDLKEIGVSAVGDRRRLLAAIAALALPVLPREARDGDRPKDGGRDERRAPGDHGDVLRSRRLDKSRVQARRGGLAQSGRGLSR